MGDMVALENQLQSKSSWEGEPVAQGKPHAGAAAPRRGRAGHRRAQRPLDVPDPARGLLRRAPLRPDAARPRHRAQRARRPAAPPRGRRHARARPLPHRPGLVRVPPHGAGARPLSGHRRADAVGRQAPGRRRGHHRRASSSTAAAASPPTPTWPARTATSRCARATSSSRRASGSPCRPREEARVAQREVGDGGDTKVSRPHDARSHRRRRHRRPCRARARGGRRAAGARRRHRVAGRRALRGRARARRRLSAAPGRRPRAQPLQPAGRRARRGAGGAGHRPGGQRAAGRAPRRRLRRRRLRGRAGRVGGGRATGAARALRGRLGARPHQPPARALCPARVPGLPDRRSRRARATA